MSNPSQKTVNEVVRVLSGRRRKLTCTLHLPDGNHIEFQADIHPVIEFNVEDRCMWLMSSGEYASKGPIMRWLDGAILLVEKNEG